MLKIVIPIPPRTKKNSSQIIKCGNRSMLIPSKPYRQYEKDCKPFMPKVKGPIEEPINMKCIYYMPTRRKVDLCNLLAASCDMLVKHGILADDNSHIVVGHDGSRVCYDKENPRAEIYLEDLI